MHIWAIADLHLAISVPGKNMGVFGPLWEGYMEKIASLWRQQIQPDDLVLIPGDISWAMTLEEARADLEWIDALPGMKVMIRGNHDYWWSSAKKMSHALPPSIRFIHNTALHHNDVAIGGTRLWETAEYNFNEVVHFQPSPFPARVDKEREASEPIFQRELERLKMSLRQMNQLAKLKIVMTHYPPIGTELRPSRASALLEEFGIHICIFGHLHNLKQEKPLFGTARGVHYSLTAADYLNFSPLQLNPCI